MANNLNLPIPIPIAQGGSSANASAFSANQVIFINSGNTAFSGTSGFTFNSSTNNLTTTTFTGALSGNSTSATTATNATNIATTSTSATSNYYPVFVASTSNSNQAADLYGGFSFIPGTGSLTMINSSTQPTNPTVTTQLNIASSTQASARIVLSGQEFGAASTTSTEGLAMLLGINTGNNRQLWLADSLLTGSNTTNPVLRMGLLGVGNSAFIDSVATNGTSVLPIKIGNDGNTTKIAGSAITLDNATTIAAGNLTASAGSFILAGSGNSINLYNAQIENYYLDGSGTILKGSIGPGRGFDFTLQSVTGGNWLRLGAASGGRISFWIDGNVAVNDSPNMSLSSAGLNLPMLSATGITTTDSGSNLTAVSSALTYTPTIGDGTNNFTTSTAVGTYYKIGSLYCFSAHIVWTGKGSASSGSQIIISLPGTSSSTDLIAATIGYASGVGFTGSYLLCKNGGNSALIGLYGHSNSGVSVTVTVSQVGSVGELIINGTFWSI